MDEFMRRVRSDGGVSGVLAEIERVVGTGRTYCSFDIDVLDPAFAPGTGTPEIGGMTTFDAQELIRGLRTLKLDLVGGDMVEVSPPFDPSGVTSHAGAGILFEMLCAIADATAARKQKKGQ